MDSQTIHQNCPQNHLYKTCVTMGHIAMHAIFLKTQFFNFLLIYVIILNKVLLLIILSRLYVVQPALL